MNRESEKQARADTGAGPAVVDLRDRVPQLDDKALASLHANALRLKDTGSTRQRASAADLIPVIEAEIASRQAVKRTAVAARSPKAGAKKAKAQTARTAEA
jgi:hypothetical protein